MPPVKASKTVETPPKPPIGKILGTWDDVKLVAKAEKDGKVRLQCTTFTDTEVIQPGEVVELRWHEGKVAAVKLPARRK